MNRDVCFAKRTLFAAVALAALACKGNEPPTTGRIQVTTATTGADLDPDGYSVTLQGDTALGTSGNATQPIGMNGKVTFSDVHPGTYSLQLGGAAVNCPIASPNPQAVTVTAGGNTDVAFHIACVQHVDLAGVWNFTEQFGSPLACNDTGSLVLTASADGFTGTSDQVGTCDRQDGSIDNSISFPVSGSATYSISGAVSISYYGAGCSYAADIAGTPPDHLTNGHVDCSSGSGPWAAVRGGGPIASVTVSPATRSVVAGGTTQLRAVLIDASGSRRVGPTVTWISDAPAVASVAPAGVVTGVASGSATITAAAESKSGTATIGVNVVTFANVQAGAYHSCGLTSGGAVYCWGHGTYGQIGDGGKADAFAPESVSTTSVTVLGVGAVQSCTLATGGAAYCWGSDFYGALGAGGPPAQLCGSEAVPCSTTPLPVAGGHTFSSINSGWNESCALATGGAAYCWGDNTYGMLGDGSTASSRTPVAVTGNATFVSVGAGILFACGLTGAGAAYCWGNNTVGQLGIGPGGPQVCGGEPCSSAPVAVSGQLTFTALSVGYWHACGVMANGAAYCWGDNADGQLGATTQELCSGLGAEALDCSTVPIAVEGGPAFASVNAGAFHTCGVSTGGAGYCWGFNGNGQLGNGTTNSSPTPTSISGGLSFATVTAFGRYHSCGLTTGGIAYCWGYNGLGELGDGTGLSALEPVQVAGQAATAGPAPNRVARIAGLMRRAPRKSLPLSPRPPAP